MISRKLDDPDLIEEVRQHLRQDTRIKYTNEMLTSCFWPGEILLNVSVDFIDELPAADVEAALPEIERAIKLRFPTIHRVFIEANAWSDHPFHSKSVDGCWSSPTTPPAKSRSIAPDERMDWGQSPPARLSNSKG